jgi:hypothetical protein
VISKPFQGSACSVIMPPGNATTATRPAVLEPTPAASAASTGHAAADADCACRTVPLRPRRLTPGGVGIGVFRKVSVWLLGRISTLAGALVNQGVCDRLDQDRRLLGCGQAGTRRDDNNLLGRLRRGFRPAAAGCNGCDDQGRADQARECGVLTHGPFLRVGSCPGMGIDANGRQREKFGLSARA